MQPSQPSGARPGLVITMIVVGALCTAGAGGTEAETYPALPGAPASRPDAALSSAIAMLDPGADVWESEVFAEAAILQLDGLRAFMEAGGPAGADDLARIVGPDFASGPLRPARISVAFEDAFYTVSRGEVAATPPAGPPTGHEGLARAVRALLDPLAGAKDLRVEFLVFGTEVGPDAAAADVAFHAYGRTAGGGVQINAVWLTQWRRSAAGAPPTLASIRVKDYEEVRDRSGRPLFGDATEGVLGRNASFRDQVIHGVDHWLERVESWIESDGFGHNGIAVGDANGDGLDDIYFCQMGGLPNLLFLQNPDGTATDVSAEAGVDWLERSRSALFADLDNDGDQDLVVATSVALLFMENDGAGHFTTRASLSVQQGLVTVPEAGETPSVGPPSGEAQGGHYSRAGDLGTADPSDLVMLAAADYDNDGRLDVYATIYHAASRDADRFPIPIPYHDANNGGSNILIRNAGNWVFADATAETGLDANNHRFSFAAAWEDFDDDGDQDLYVANDFGRNNLYRNDGGRFTDIAAAAGVEDIGAGMSASWGDYDQDGRMDVYVGNMFSASGSRLAAQSMFMHQTNAITRMMYRRHAKGNSLFRNKGDGTFSDVSETAGITRSRWAWDSKMVDLDNDSREDLLVSNGYFTRDELFDLYSFFWRQVVARSPPGPADGSQVKDYAAAWTALGRLIRMGKSFNGRERNSAFLNAGGGRFAEFSALSGLDFIDDARAGAVTDWDQDGDLDIWFTNRTGPRLRLALNGSPTEGRFVAFRLEGRRGNRDAIGARLELRLAGAPAGRKLIRTLRAGDGYLSQSSKWVHFGLGKDAAIEALLVRWPGGIAEEFHGVEAGGRYRIVEGSGTAEPWGGPRAVRLETSEIPVTPATDRARIFLSAPAPAPDLSYLDLDGGRAVFDRKGTGLVLVTLWSAAGAAGEEQLAAFARGEQELRKARVGVLALSVDGADGSAPRDAASARALAAKTSFPFVMGMATPEMIDKLDVVQREVLWSPRPLPDPTTFVVDGDDLLAAVYKGPLAVEELLADLPALRSAGDKRLRLAIPFPGRRQTRGSPDFFGYMDGIAQAYVKAGHIDEGARYYQKVLRIQPNRIETRFNLGAILADLGRIDEAIEQYREVLRLQPDHVAALNNLGYALAGRGDRQEAVVHYRRALDIDPNNVSTLDNLGTALAAEGALDEAVAVYRRALDTDPDSQPVLNNLAVALARQGNDEEAIGHYRRLLALDGGNIPVRINLGVALVRQGKTGEGIDYLAEAARLAPGLPESHYHLGVARLRQGALPGAAAALEEAVRLRPEYSQALYYLGLTSARMGGVEDAVRRFSAALGVPPDSPIGPERLAWVLATHQDPALRDGRQAVRIAQWVCDATGNSRVPALDALAAAYAEAGSFPEAAKTARRAIDLARTQGRAQDAASIEQRLRLYESGRPFHESAGGR